MLYHLISLNPRNEIHVGCLVNWLGTILAASLCRKASRRPMETLPPIRLQGRKYGGQGVRGGSPEGFNRSWRHKGRSGGQSWGGRYCVPFSGRVGQVRCALRINSWKPRLRMILQDPRRCEVVPFTESMAQKPRFRRIHIPRPTPKSPTTWRDPSEIARTTESLSWLYSIP